MNEKGVDRIFRNLEERPMQTIIGLWVFAGTLSLI
jgi:hypothetical protein